MVYTLKDCDLNQFWKIWTYSSITSLINYKLGVISMEYFHTSKHWQKSYAKKSKGWSKKQFKILKPISLPVGKRVISFSPKCNLVRETKSLNANFGIVSNKLWLMSKLSKYSNLLNRPSEMCFILFLEKWSSFSFGLSLNKPRGRCFIELSEASSVSRFLNVTKRLPLRSSNLFLFIRLQKIKKNKY